MAFDATKILGQLLEQGMGGGNNRMQQQGGLGQILSQLGGASATRASAGGGGLADMLGGLLAQAQSAGTTAANKASTAASQPGGINDILANVAEMAKRGADTAQTGVKANDPAVIGGLGALAGLLVGGGRGAIGGGLMAALGSLAYSALAKAQAGEAAPAAAVPASLPGYHDEGAVQRKAQLMLRAMINAAKADGQIDGQEIQRITGKLMESGDGNEAARAFVLQQMQGPADIAGLVKDVASPQDAAEVYAASVLAITVDTQAEKDYLARLAGALRLSPDAVAHIHATLGARA
jgi:uncharacterized membrane protein YebE (DUF533 family)